MVDPNLTVMRRVTPLPFEMVVREYMRRSKTNHEFAACISERRETLLWR